MQLFLLLIIRSSIRRLDQAATVLDESSVDFVPAATSDIRRTQEQVDIAQIAMIERVVRVVLDDTQIGDVLAREALPRGRVGEHEIGVNDEERQRDHQTDDEHLHVEEYEQVFDEPV